VASAANRIYLILSVLFLAAGYSGISRQRISGVSEDPPLIDVVPGMVAARHGQPNQSDADECDLGADGINLAWETALPLPEFNRGANYLFKRTDSRTQRTLSRRARGFRLGRIYPVLLCHQAVLACVGGRIPIRVFAFHREPHDLRASDSYLMCVPPLVCYFSLQRFNGDITSRGFVILMTLSAGRAVSNLPRDFRHHDPILRARAAAGSWPNFG